MKDDNNSRVIKVWQIILLAIAGFICLASWGQLSSWYEGFVLYFVLLGVHLLSALALLLLLIKAARDKNAKRAKLLYWLMFALILLPTVVTIALGTYLIIGLMDYYM